MTEPPFEVNHVRPSTRDRGQRRKTPQMVDAILDTVTTGKAVLVPPIVGESLEQTRARVANAYGTIKRQGLRMRTAISHHPPGVYVWAERTEDETT